MSADLVQREASTLMRLLRHLRTRQANITMTELTVLLAVAENEGLTMTGLALLCGFSAATASRTARGLAPAEMPGALAPFRGLLVLMRGPHENRFRHIFLTPRGRALCREMDHILHEDTPRGILPVPAMGG